MTRQHSIKRSLVASILILCLCFTTLIGTTFAWFTDSVTSANNIIKTGKLDIGLEYATVKDGQISGWSNVDGADEIFDPNALWEPGRVEVAYLKVSNLGDLALKYQLAVNVVEENEGTNVDGEKFKLSDHLVFKVVEMPDALTTYTDREAVTNAAGTEKGLKDHNGKTTALEVGGVDYMALIVYMPESVGNVANYRGDDIPTIKLGVNMYATQQMAEEDSFGSDYDANAWHPSMKVNNAAEFIQAANGIEEGGTIVLANDLTFNADAYTDNGGWNDGLYFDGDKSFTIDLNGKKITNDSKINDYLLNFRNVGEKANTITIKNGTIEAASSAYCAICTSSNSTQKITVNLENVKVIGNNSNGSVVKVRGGAELNVKAGTVITGNDSYLGIENWKATVNIYDGAEIYQNGKTSYNGSLVGVGGGNAVVNVYGGYGKGAKGGFIAMTSGGTINVSGGEWIANTDGTYAGDNAAVLIAQSDKRASSVINVTGGIFKGGFNGYGNVVGDAMINISGGTFSTKPADGMVMDVADECAVIDLGNGMYGVFNGTAGGTVNVGDGAVLDLGGVEFKGTIVAEGDLTIKGDTKIQTLKATKGGTITLTSATRAVGEPTLTLNNFSFGTSATAGSKYVITGGTVVANYGFFQHGNYELYSNFETGYMYYSYGSDITVYGTFHSQGKGDGLDYVRGTLTVANGGKSIHDKSLWVGQPASWGAMNATLIVEDGGYVEANSISVYAGSKIVVDAKNVENGAYTSIKYNSFTKEGDVIVAIADGLGIKPETAANDYFVYSADGLAAMNAMMADKSAGRDAVVNLLCDIDFAGKTWTTVDSHADSAFEIAEINGNGYTIYNLTVSGQAMFSRFAGTGDVVIKNITFDGATVKSTSLNASILTGQTYQNVLLDNVDVKNSSITGAYKVAPLIATVYDEKATSITATLKNCDVSNTTVTSTQYDFFTCGLVSFVYTTNNDYVEYENCTVTDVALKAVSGGYNYHANIHYTSADTDDQINEHPGVTVTNVTFEKIG